jgi:hypothetical protein
VRRRDDDLDVVVVGDHGEAVLVAQAEDALEDASRACAIFSPPIEPERSRTKARLTGRRPGRFGASGAWISASRKRRLLAPV